LDGAMSRSLKSLIPKFARDRFREIRWPPIVARFLPGDSRQFGPPRRWMPSRKYLSTHPGTFREVLPAQGLPRPQPEFLEPERGRFIGNYLDQVPPASIFTLGEARLLGPEGWIVAPGDVFLVDASFEGNVANPRLADHTIFRTRRGRAPSLKRLQGRCLSLASDYAVGGFGHFIHDSLTRLLLVELAGLRLSEFAWVYLPHLETPIVRAMIARLGIPRDRILNYDASTDLLCESLTATTFPGTPGYIATVYVEFLRRRFAPTATRRDRRIYLSRSGHRRNFSNLAEVEAVLRRFGFEEVRAHEDEDALRKCAEAALVFCIEGASFFNAFACPRGTRVLMVYPDLRSHAQPYALSFAEAAGFKPVVMVGKSAASPEIDAGIANLYLDPMALSAQLARMIPS
jgi:hypothetical protein